MNKNVNELEKIMDSTSGFFKGKSRRAISKAIKVYKPKINAVKSLPDTDKKDAYIALLNQATSERHIALQNGANSYGHPAWAAAATIESWLFELINGTPEGVIAVEAVVEKLNSRA